MSIVLIVFGCITVVVGISLIHLTLSEQKELKDSERAEANKCSHEYEETVKPLLDRFAESKKKYDSAEVCARKEDEIISKLLSENPADLDAAKYHLNKYGNYTDQMHELVAEMEEIGVQLREFQKQYGIT